MCGIAGFVGPFDLELLGAMSRAIAHRGPDDDDALVLEGGPLRTGLAHRRLSIIDLSPEGRQPMDAVCPCCGVPDTAPPEARIWLTYNGEIYNYRELRKELEAAGHAFHSQTDSEVLLHLYADQGYEMLHRLNGIFALALYDGRPTGQRGDMARGDLLIARDGLGVKPLYYADAREGFLFASELKSLLEWPDLPRDLDPVALHQYLAYLWAPASRTPLRSVRKLRPGEVAIVHEGRLRRRWTYYDLPYGGPLLRGSEGEIAEELASMVEQAVGRQMMADVPLGAFLSGGLDSSSVVTMMRRTQPDARPTCYSIGFAGDTPIEGVPADLPYARKVAAHLGVDLRTIEILPDMIRNLERMLYFLDEPQADPAPINALLIAEQARRDGIKVLLSGAGGDDIFSGYRRHWALRMERTWGWLPLAMRRGLAGYASRARSGTKLGTRIGGTAWARRARKLLSNVGLPGEDRLIGYFFWSGEQLRRSLYGPWLAEALEDVDAADPLRESLRRIPSERDPLNRMLYLEAKHFLADHNLNYTDKTGMAAAVEIRVPLLDLELVDFSTRIPTQMKQKGRVGKAIFKKAMEPYLPREVIHRAKSGFGAPLRRWMRHELRDAVEETLSKRSLDERGLFDSTAIQKLIEMDRSGQVDGAYTLFAVMCIELWCRMFLDGRVPALGPPA